jgi:uncharacterized protein (TIGR03086 family)
VTEEIGERHLRVCSRFGEAVAAADGCWDQRSPCTEWNARGVVEHVIGFHDVLLLRPLGAKPDRPRDDPAQRWSLTYDALRDVMSRPGLFDRSVDVPAVGNNPPTQLDARNLVPALTQDVLVHTWDLARAVQADDRLDPELCEFFYTRLPADPAGLVASGMFGLPVTVDSSVDAQSRLLARLGRDPNWSAT